MSTTPTADARRWLSLAVLLVPASLTLISTTSVNVALPAIRDSLDASPVERTLVLTGYALAYAIVLLPAGRLGDRIGHTKVFLAGTAMFALANLWSGLAPDPAQLIAARAIAGVSAGLVVTPVTALIQLLFAPQDRARPFGIMGAVFGASTAVGPLVGGLLLQGFGTEGWHAVFLVNVPVAVLALALAVVVLPKDRGLAERGSDHLGTAVFALALAATILPFSMGLQPLSAGVLTAGAVLWAVFALRMRSRARRALPVAVAPRVVAGRALPWGLVVAFLGFAGFTGAFLLLALLWQDALGRTPLEAGLLVVPFAVGNLAGAAATGRLTERFGTRLVVAGLAMVAAGMGAVGVLVLLAPDALSIAVMALPLLVTGLGAGLFIGPNTNDALSQTDRRDAGVASALVSAAQRCGTAVGIGVLSTLYATLPGGAAAMSTQAAAAFTTTAFALVGALVMALERRGRTPLAH